MTTKVLLIFLMCLSVNSVAAAGYADTCAAEITSEQQFAKVMSVNYTGVGIVTVWGVLQWDYFSRSPHSQSEGWFGNDTDDGGADKLGHLYTSYVTSHGFSSLFSYWCFNKHDAAFYGALSSFSVWGYMELGDSFSDYGFSKEDLWMNALGSVLGYYLYENENLASKIDMRWEYGLHPTGTDFTTDYENSKYLIALKLSGFEKTSGGFSKYLELQLGYYARGFYDPAVTNERNLYFGIGINLSELFRRGGYKKTAAAFNYLQVPATYISIVKDQNK
ncbi:MAG: YfiM family protein [Gammaproteobacteria bacterium]|nr:YfiM family protein [Gammaproteobacteria bacterium]